MGIYKIRFVWYARKRLGFATFIAVCLFGLNVAFNNFSVISRWCLVVTGAPVHICSLVGRASALGNGRSQVQSPTYQRC